MRAIIGMVHGAFADAAPGSTEAPLAGSMRTEVPTHPSLGTLLQNQLLADAARHEPRLYLIFARAQQHTGRPYADRVCTAAYLKQQADDLISRVAGPGSAAQLAAVHHTIDHLLLLAGQPTDPAAEPVADVAADATETRRSTPRGRGTGRVGDSALSTVNPQAATPALGTTMARPSATPDAVEPGAAGAAGAPVLPTARGAALAGPADPSPPPVPASDAEMRRVSDLLHAQADRVLEDAAQLSHRADETRAVASDQDAQADALYGRAERLHTQADQVCPAGERANAAPATEVAVAA